jgi:hypothetical protein
MVMKMWMFFQILTQCGLVGGYCFGGMYHLHLWCKSEAVALPLKTEVKISSKMLVTI